MHDFLKDHRISFVTEHFVSTYNQSKGSNAIVSQIYPAATLNKELYIVQKNLLLGVEVVGPTVGVSAQSIIKGVLNDPNNSTI